MKKFNLMVAVATACVCFFSSCGANKNAVSNVPSRSGNPFGDVYELPAAEYDTDEYFGATGIATGPATRQDILQSAALTNAQNLVRQKMKHAYQGMIDDYSNYVGTNAGTDAETKIERGGTQIIDALVNETRATKVVFSGIDDKGNMTCYTGIRISKKDLAEKIADKVTDAVSEDEELKIRFKEEQFRQKMDEHFKKFKENK